MLSRVLLVRSFAVAALLVGSFQGLASAAVQDFKSHAGYIEADLSKLVGDRKPSVQITLEPVVLRMLASAGKQSDPDINDLVKDLSFVRVNVYDGLKLEAATIASELDAQAAALLGKGWSSVVKVREEGSDQRVDAMIKVDNNKIVGVVVMVADTSDLVFVNIAGNMDPDKFGEKVGKVVARATNGELKLTNLGEVLGNSSNNVKEGEPEAPADEAEKSEG